MKKFLMMGLLVLSSVSFSHGYVNEPELLYEIIKKLEKSNVPAIRAIADSAGRGLKDIVAVGLIDRLYKKDLLIGSTDEIDKGVLQQIATWKIEPELKLAEEVLKLDQSREYKAVKEAAAIPAEKAKEEPVSVPA